ncbi:MAG: hypothetical protein ACYC2H_12745 [Thermoplasmatota archaeon]
MRQIAAVLLILFMSGCATQTRGPPVLEPVEVPLTSPNVTLSDCLVADSFVLVERSAVAPHVPAPYDTSDYLGLGRSAGLPNGVSGVDVRALQCHATTPRGNDSAATVLTTLVQLWTQPPAGAYGANNYYLLELWLDPDSSPALAATFEQEDIPFQAAAISVEEAAVTLTAPGVHYAIRRQALPDGAPALPLVNGELDWERWHRLEGGLQTFLDLRQDQAYPTTQSFASLEMTGGIWAEIAQTEAGNVAGSWSTLRNQANLTWWSEPDPFPFPAKFLDPDIEPDELSLFDCTGWEFQLLVDKAAASDLLPDGYEPILYTGAPWEPLLPGTPTAAFASADLDILRCKAFLGQVSHGTPTIAWVDLGLSAAGGHEGDLFRDTFLVETYVDGASDALVALLEAHGFPVVPATVVATESGAQINTKDVSYRFDCGPDNSLMGNGLPGQRAHSGQGGNLSWMDLEGVLWRSEPGSPSPWTAEGGILSSLTAASGSAQTIPSRCAEVYGLLQAEFGRSD